MQEANLDYLFLIFLNDKWLANNLHGSWIQLLVIKYAKVTDLSNLTRAKQEFLLTIDLNYMVMRSY